MKLEQAARQALEALEVSTDWDVGAKGKQLQSMKAITALREALAEQEEPINKFDSILSWANSCPIKQPILAEQAEQEPVAWVTAKESFCGFPKLVFSETQKDGYKPLYAAPVRTKDLTDDEIRDAFYSCGFGGCRAVIAADREKNRG